MEKKAKLFANSGNLIRRRPRRRLCQHRRWLKIFVNVFKRLYLLNLGTEVVHTCPDVRYWSEVLCYIIPTHMSDLEVKSC